MFLRCDDSKTPDYGLSATIISVSHDIALYIHIPFCRHKCSYCSFVSYEQCEAYIPAYLDAIKSEIMRHANGERLQSIYFGGGTPSLLSAEQIGSILSTINRLFTIDKSAEISIEANPGTINRQYLTDIRKLGVNRLSLGVQSMKDSELVLLGRIHRKSEVIDSVHFARDSGFDNVNMDLIYGIPGQTLKDWQNNLAEIIDMNPDHLSLYALTLESNTKLGKAIEAKSLPSIDPDLSADQYEFAEDLLTLHNYQHYEISNWAKPGQQCRHNIVYWQNLPYLGVGIASHSHLNGRRLANTSSLEKYLDAFSKHLIPPVELDEEIGTELQLAETVILGLRLCEGIYLKDLPNHSGIDLPAYYSQRLEELVGSGLLEYNNGHIKLTRRGRLLSNEVFWRFLPD